MKSLIQIKGMWLLAAAALMLLTGCAHMNHTESGTLVGTGIGATTGAMIGSHSGHAGGGALIGAAAGALGGALVGNAQDMAEERDAAVVAAQQAEWRRQADAQAVTNQDVIRMSQQGLSDEVITGAIRTRGGRFELSPEGLISLKSQGVSDGVLSAMQQGTPQPYVSSSTTVTPASSTTIVQQPRPVVYVTPPRPTAHIVIGPRPRYRGWRRHRHHHHHYHW